MKSVGYDAIGKILEIEFNNGDIWHYFDVPEATAKALQTALSVGKYFFAHIRGKFNEEKQN